MNKQCEKCKTPKDIFPVSKFDPNTPMSVVNALDNLQPLWAFDNLSKNNNIL